VERREGGGVDDSSMVVKQWLLGNEVEMVGSGLRVDGSGSHAQMYLCWCESGMIPGRFWFGSLSLCLMGKCGRW